MAFKVPGRSDGGISIRVEKLVVAGETKLHGGRAAVELASSLLSPLIKKTDERGRLIIRQIGRPGILAFSILDGRGKSARESADRSLRSEKASRVVNGHFFSMADAALAHVDAARTIFAGVRARAPVQAISFELI